MATDAPMVLREGAANLDEYIGEIMELSPDISNRDLAEALLDYVAPAGLTDAELDLLHHQLVEQMPYYTGRDK